MLINHSKVLQSPFKKKIASSELKGLYVNPYQLQKINSYIQLGDKKNAMEDIAHL